MIEQRTAIRKLYGLWHFMPNKAAAVWTYACRDHPRWIEWAWALQDALKLIIWR